MVLLKKVPVLSAVILFIVVFIVDISCHKNIKRSKPDLEGSTVNRKSAKLAKGVNTSPAITKRYENYTKPDRKAKPTQSENVDIKYQGRKSKKQKLAARNKKHAHVREGKIGRNEDSNNYIHDQINCWMNFSSEFKHLVALDKLDAQYSDSRKRFQTEFGNSLEKKLMSGLVFQAGAAERAKHQASKIVCQIPAGLNLGGYGLMRLPNSVLFFHRMKLRNNTVFRVNFLNLDLENMALTVSFSLNDLHLQGAYERSRIEKDPSIMYYAPSYGEMQILVKGVYYKMEGRLRIINNKLLIELVNADMISGDILMMYIHQNKTSEAKILSSRMEMDDFMSRVKCDLNTWLKDFFNDYLMYFVEMENTDNTEYVLEYEKKKTVLANEYADFVLDSIRNRLKELKSTTVKMPHFTIYPVVNMRIKLHNGVLRGLDSIYRRSIATTKMAAGVRKVDAIIGFSKLKAEYQYEAVTGTGLPPVSGTIILIGDELTAHMEVSEIKMPASVDLKFDDLVQTKPEAVTIEGPGNRVIANFKQVLEHEIIALMSNSMMYIVKMLKTVTECEPYIHGADETELEDVYDYEQAENDLDVGPINDDKGSKNIENDDVNINEDEDYAWLEGDDQASERDDLNVKLSEDADYFLTKNDSIEVEVPVNGHVEKMKIKSYNEFKVIKPQE